jgi:hypothetical protein
MDPKPPVEAVIDPEISPESGYSEGTFEYPTWESAFTSGQLRLAAILVLLMAGSVLGIAAWLNPDSRGYGTHEQLPFQGPCGFLLTTGYPCPTCGMTTAFSYTMHGNWLAAIKAQPGGWVLAIGSGLAVLMSIWVLITGQLPGWFVRWVTPFRFFVAMLVIVLGSWGLVLVIGTFTGAWPTR